MQRLVITHPLPTDLHRYFPDGDVAVPSEGPMTRTRLVEAIAEAEALICLLHDRIDEELLSCAPRLRIVANLAVGLDNIDLAAATRRGILVTHTPDVLTEATADLTLALLLAVARRVVEADALVRSGGWQGWAPDLLLGADVFGASLGLVGLGRIGLAVLQRARGFQMRVRYVARDPRKRRDAADANGATQVSLDELLAESDFVSLHAPLSEATRGLIGARELGLMKPTAFLLNTARGALVDENALAEALRSGRIAGAGLDVFGAQPHVPEDLLACPRVVALPHIGSATFAARARMAELCLEAVQEVFAGRRPAHVVNPEVLPT